MKKSYAKCEKVMLNVKNDTLNVKSGRSGKCENNNSTLNVKIILVGWMTADR